MKRPEGSLSSRSLARLVVELDRMPPTLAFLRGAILSLADQDEGLLGCGEINTTVFDADMRQWQRSAGRDADVTSLNNEFAAWAAASPKGKWVSPIWYVQGLLCGVAAYDPDLSAPPQPTMPAALGLELLDVDVPAEWTTKLRGSAVELKHRKATVWISEVTDAERKHRPDPASPNWSASRYPPHLRVEWDDAFSFVGGSGLRQSLRHVESGLEVVRLYWLEVASVWVEVMITAKPKLGFDLQPFEAIVASLRPKVST